MNLTPHQRTAVERTGQDVCVVAGPGAGKTRVLIERFAWLVEQHRADPTRILAITFTEKAATEIKERLIARFAGNLELRESMERAWVSTIDGFCARLLRENAITAGLVPDFAVLDQPVAERLKSEAAEEALDALFEERPVEMRRLLEALDLSTQEDGPQPDLARSLLIVYDAMRVAGVREFPAPVDSNDTRAAGMLRESLSDPETGNTDKQILEHAKLKEWAAEFLSLPPSPVAMEHFRLLNRFTVNAGLLVKGSIARRVTKELKDGILRGVEARFLEAWNRGLHDLLRAAVERIDALYREKKRLEAALDFGDLEEQAIRLLETDAAIRDEVTGRFDQILMDELQDTNRLQWRLVDLIRRRFFAVGDVNQSIYGFRHAEPAVFEDYRRTLANTGAAIDDLRQNHRSRAEILDAVSRLLDGEVGIEPRPLTAVRQFPASSGVFVERLVGRGDQAAEAEAALVAARIRELVEDGSYQYKDIGILVRALGSTPPIERALDRLGIPFLLSGGRTFLEAREIRDVLALLAALVNPLDEIPLVGVLRGPMVGMSDEEIFHASKDEWREIFENLFGPLRRLAGFIAPDRLLVRALDESGYASGLSERARANIGKLLAWVRREHASRPRPLAELLDDLESLRTTQSEAEAPPPEAGDTVRIMSIHAAKGLEFPVVFISAIHRSPNRSKDVIAFSPGAGLGVKWRNPATGKGHSDTAHAAIMEELKHKEEAEENRLLYVAMTRAEDRLIFSYAERGRPSRWRKLVEAGVPETKIEERAPSLTRKGSDAPAYEFVEPVHAPQHDSSAAVTSVATFAACPRKYYLSDYLGLEPEYEGPVTGGLALGSEVHAILSGTAESGVSPEARELAGRFNASELGRRSVRAARIEREFDFLLHLEGIVLRGQIDLWFEEAGELVLVDYKTDRDEFFSPAYALQLRLYALALERYAGRLPDRAALCYLRSGRTVEVILAPEELEAARAAVRSLMRAQESLEFPLKVGTQCQRCVYFRNLCPAV